MSHPAKSPNQRTSARRMISIPIELDEGMRAHPGINWSRVAREAFAAVLGRLEQGLSPTPSPLELRLEAVEARLKALAHVLDVRVPPQDSP